MTVVCVDRLTWLRLSHLTLGNFKYLLGLTYRTSKLPPLDELLLIYLFLCFFLRLDNPEYLVCMTYGTCKLLLIIKPCVVCFFLHLSINKCLVKYHIVSLITFLSSFLPSLMRFRINKLVTLDLFHCCFCFVNFCSFSKFKNVNVSEMSLCCS